MTYNPVQRVFFFTLLILATMAFAWLLYVFVLPIFWAVTFAILCGRFTERLARRLKGRMGLASALTIAAVVLLVLVPVLLLGLAVTKELTGLMAAIQSGDVDAGAPLRWFHEQAPTVSDYAARYGVDLEGLRGKLSEIALYAGQWLAGNALRIGQNALQFFAGITLMLYLLFFFLRDGAALVDRLVRVLPLGDVRERHLFHRFAEVVRATVQGTFVIAAVQGALGGCAFWAVGIRGAIVWGVVMAGASLVPVIGSALIWLPAAIMLMTSGALVKGIALVVVGVVLIGAVDNLLRPVLVGRQTNMPDYLVLLATLGGLALFGITGLVMGPLIASLFVTLWEMFEEIYGDREDEPERPVDQPGGIDQTGAID